jgi:hypothetical protein
MPSAGSFHRTLVTVRGSEFSRPRPAEFALHTGSWIRTARLVIMNPLLSGPVGGAPAFGAADRFAAGSLDLARMTMEGTIVDLHDTRIHRLGWLPSANLEQERTSPPP